MLCSPGQSRSPWNNSSVNPGHMTSNKLWKDEDRIKIKSFKWPPSGCITAHIIGTYWQIKHSVQHSKSCLPLNPTAADHSVERNDIGLDMQIQNILMQCHRIPPQSSFSKACQGHSKRNHVRLYTNVNHVSMQSTSLLPQTLPREMLNSSRCQYDVMSRDHGLTGCHQIRPRFPNSTLQPCIAFLSYEDWHDDKTEPKMTCSCVMQEMLLQLC